LRSAGFTAYAAYAARSRNFHVVVVGGGQMGSGIAQVSALAGHKVTVCDLSPDLLGKSQKGIQSSLQRMARKQFEKDVKAGEEFVANTMKNISVQTDASRAVTSADLVVEAIVENVKVKQNLFSALDAVAPAKTIFASNTSSLSIAEIASGTKRADRFGGLHFFNPVPVMALVEVVRTPELSGVSLSWLQAFATGLGKTAITCTDTPGFVVNRLLVPYLTESIRLKERNVASTNDIDTAMRLGAGHPMGPLALCDMIGLDTIKHILDGWTKQFPNDKVFQPIPLLDEMVNSGKLGKKSGEGFYKYDRPPTAPPARS